MKFSIGYNNDIKLLDLLDVYKDNIEALYFPIPYQYSGSGRHISQKSNYINEIPKLIKKCNSLNIKSQLLLNATCEGKRGLEKNFFSRIINYLQKLKNLGLKSVIVTNPVYISEIKEQIKGIEIESSVNCYVKTVEQALYLRDLGVDILTIDRDINRNIPLIKEIRNKTGLKIRILLNEGCLRNCPFRKMHYNFIAHTRLKSKAKKIGGIFFERWGAKIFSKNPAKVFSIPFIPPDALKYYLPFVDYFKISGRDNPTSSIEFFLKAYINQDFKGNLLKILDSPCASYFAFIDYGALLKNNFFEKMIKCNSNCNECNYCNKLMKEAVVLNSDFLKGRQKAKEDKKAVNIYKRALGTSQDKISIYSMLSRAYFNLKKYEQAIKQANKVIELAPREIASYHLLGLYYEQSKRRKDTLKLYKKAVEIFPTEGSIYLGLARAYFSLKRYQEAIKLADKAIGLNYKQANIYLLLGLCYQKTKQYRKAIKKLKKAQGISPKEPQINFSLSNCYRNIGQTEQANKELEKWLVKFKESKPASFSQKIKV